MLKKQWRWGNGVRLAVVGVMYNYSSLLRIRVDSQPSALCYPHG